MAVITPLSTVSNPQVPTRTLLKAHVERTKLSEKEKTSQLLDSFLKNSSGTAPDRLALAKPIPSKPSESTILNLPLTVIKRILRNLLTSRTPLILHPDPITPPQNPRTHIHPNVLQICKAFHNIAVPILYGENTLTTSSPAASFAFDRHLRALPGNKRQLITAIKLEIDWAHQLWAKLPLLATALAELKRLRKLELLIVGDDRSVAIDGHARLEIFISYGQCPSGCRNGIGARGQAPAIDRVMTKREGTVADAMIRAEMKTLEDLVMGIKGLRCFRLVGFRDRGFARRLEERVRCGRTY